MGAPRKPFDVEQATADYEAGRSLAEIALKQGMQRATVSKRLAENGVTIRPRGGRRKLI